MYCRLKILRKKNNISQKKLALLLDIPQSLYSKYETGKMAIPVSVLSKLAKYYNTSIDYIVGDTDEITKF